MEVKQDSECVYDRDVEARSRNNFCHGGAVSITYSKRVFVDLGIQHAKRMRHIVHLWPTPLYIIFPHYPTNDMIFGKTLLNIQSVCLIFPTTFV